MRSPRALSHTPQLAARAIQRVFRHYNTRTKWGAMLQRLRARERVRQRQRLADAAAHARIVANVQVTKGMSCMCTIANTPLVQ